MPMKGDTATISTGDTVTLDIENLEVDQLIWEGNATTDAVLQCSNGATLTIYDWTSTATTDFFAAQLSGSDANGGTTHADAEQSFAALAGHAGSGVHLLMQKGGVYPIIGDGTMPTAGTLGSYGRGDGVNYGPRPLVNLGASNTLTHTGTGNVTQYHSEISCGDVLTAEPILDRYECVGPCAIEFKLDVNHTQLPSIEALETPLSDGRETGTGGHIRGGADWLMPTTTWDFGDPGSGVWQTGARAEYGEPWPRNFETPAPLAYHVYEHPGRYVVTSETTWGGETVQNTMVINITSPEVEWNDADTFCFANTPDTFEGCPHDTNNDGTCEDHVGNCVVTTDADVAMGSTSTNCDLDTQSYRCLFARGDTFDLETTVDVTTTDDWMIGAFGDPTAERPIFDMTAGSTKDGATVGVQIGIEFQADSKNGRIMDIIFQGDGLINDQKAMAHNNFNATSDCQGPEFDNLLIGNVLVRDTGNAVNLRGSTSYGQGGAAYLPTCGSDNVVMYELVTQDSTYGKVCTGDSDPCPGGDCIDFHGDACVSTGSTCTGGDTCQFGCAGQTGAGAARGSCGLDVFGHGNSFAILGGDLANREFDEHGMRIKRGMDFTIAHGDWARIGQAGENAGCGGPRGVLLVRDGPSGNAATRPAPNGGPITEDELGTYYSARFSIHDNHMGICAANGQSLHVEATSNGDDWEHWHSYHVFANLFNAAHKSDSYPLGDPQVGTAESHFKFQGGGQDFMVANNAFWLDTGAIQSGATVTGASVNNIKGNSGATADTMTQRAYIFNNTYFAPSSNLASVTPVDIDNDTEDTFVANNLFVDLDSNADWIEQDVGAENVVECNGSGTACNVEETTNVVSGELSTEPVPRFEWFKLVGSYTGTPANNEGVVPDSGTVLTDAFNKCRGDGTAAWQGVDNNGAAPCLNVDNTAQNTANLNAAVGVNIQRNEEFHPGTPWVNLMHRADGWYEDDGASVCGDANNGDYSGDLDDAGYPLDELATAAYCIYVKIFEGPYAAGDWELGTYTVEYTGTATLVGGGDVESVSCSGSPDVSCTFSLDGDADDVILGFTALTSLSNMRVYPPGGVCAAEATAPYGGFEPWSYCDTGGLTLIEEDTCTGDYAQCVPLDDAAENAGLTFHPLFMKRVKPYRAIRLMDWARTNNITEAVGGAIQTERNWPPVGMFSYNYNVRHLTPQGFNNPGAVPPEIQIKFCQQLGAECWVNIPHLASDAEIERLGALCRDETELNCIFELSNETWNPKFGQHNEIWDLADTAYGNCSARGNNACRDAWVGNRTGEMCDLLEGVFDQTGEDSRMICVLGTQGSSTTVTDNRIDCDCSSGCGTGAPTCDWTNLDGLAIALYFGVDTGDGTGGDPDMTGDCDQASPATVAGLANGVSDSMAEDIAARITGGSDWVSAQVAELASQSLSSVDLYVYEGGTNYADTTSNSGLCLDAQVATCTPGTGDCIYDQYEDALDGYEAHFSVDGESIRNFMTFTTHSTYDTAANRSGWADGILSSMGNRGSWTGAQSAWPKEDAILDWSAANPCWWASCALGSAPAEPPSSAPGIQGGGGGGWGLTYMPLEQSILWNLVEAEE